MGYLMFNIEEAIRDFDKIRDKDKEEQLERLRKDFVNSYPLNKIKVLSLKEYCIGFKQAGNNNYKTFCYRIENELKELGDMHGSTASKFGVYYTKIGKDYNYEYVKKFGSDLNQAFHDLKHNITKLLEKYNNPEVIKESSIAPIFRYKLLATYYPEKFLPITNEKHVNEFLNELDLNYTDGTTMLEKQNLLIVFKNSNKISSEWSNYYFMKFLYTKVPIPSRLNKIYNEQQNNAKKEFKKNNQLTIEENKWLDLLNNNTVFCKSDVDFFKTFYCFENHSFIYEDFLVTNGIDAKSFNTEIIDLVTRILNNTKVNFEDKDSYWNMLFYGRRLESGKYELKIVDSLTKALEHIFSNLKCNNINNKLDETLTFELKNEDSLFEKVTGEYSKFKEKKPGYSFHKGVNVYKRDKKKAVNALKISGYKCEYNNEHPTFKRKKNNINYTEPHHLIPMSYQDDFEYSIDIEENIVSLCSNCHNEIHYGKNAERIILSLFESRKKLLLNKGIKITEEKLLEYYGIKHD